MIKTFLLLLAAANMSRPAAPSAESFAQRGARVREPDGAAATCFSIVAIARSRSFRRLGAVLGTAERDQVGGDLEALDGEARRSPPPRSSASRRATRDGAGSASAAPALEAQRLAEARAGVDRLAAVLAVDLLDLRATSRSIASASASLPCRRICTARLPRICHVNVCFSPSDLAEERLDLEPSPSPPRRSGRAGTAMSASPFLHFPTSKCFGSIRRHSSSASRYAVSDSSSRPWFR